MYSPVSEISQQQQSREVFLNFSATVSIYVTLKKIQATKISESMMIIELRSIIQSCSVELIEAAYEGLYVSEFYFRRKISVSILI